ncbi:hypothetical protein J4732_05890 [Serratia marcescens]|uniref:Uncharacterized protein n=1 Tax=Serratia marcescens TaxID=615 RepID=A0A939NQ65_SERMA|nr:hypothetical protein [Serratia marcescens]
MGLLELRRDTDPQHQGICRPASLGDTLNGRRPGGRFTGALIADPKELRRQRAER